MKLLLASSRIQILILLSFYYFEETIGKSFLIETAENKMHGSSYQLPTQRADLRHLTDGLVAVTDELLGNKLSSNGSDYQLDQLATLQSLQAQKADLEAEARRLTEQLGAITDKLPGRKFPPNVEEIVGVINNYARTVLPNLDTNNEADIKSVTADLDALFAELVSKQRSEPQDQVGNEDQNGNEDQGGNEDQDGNQDNFYV